MLQAVATLREENFKLRLDQSERFDDIVVRLQRLREDLPSSLGEEAVSTVTEAIPDELNTAADMMKQIEDERENSDGSYVSTGGIKIPNAYNVKMLEEGISKLALTEQDLAVVTKQQKFLRSLNFPSRLHRHDDIPMAHTTTFEWLLDTREETQHEDGKEKSRLALWLRHEGGIFWVSGKPGAGKSTLMKFIADHEETRRLLENWAKPKKLVIATHYFWTAGTSLQKSQKGLLQSLLYDIFRTCPEQISEMCPHRWSSTSPAESTRPQEWLIHELLETLQKLGKSSSLTSKLCMFIDGVDEFDGDHFELCQVFKELSTSPNFKICLSSRPWNVFEDAFGLDQSQKICIQDLTRQDILVYARGRLMQHNRWSKGHFSQDLMDSVIEKITERANGVFLWVFLVTTSLRKGLSNGDTITDLQRRLDSLPTDLESFFRHMLDVVEPFYHQKMARVLQIAVNARQSLDLQFYHIHEYEDEDKDYAINRSTESHAPDRLDETLDQCRRRINAICGGLLEIKKQRVEFLHRTVRDFLRTREISDYLSKESGRDFMVNLSTLKGHVFLFKCWVNSTNAMSLALDEPFWKEGLKYANDALQESQEAALAHLDAVEDLYLDISVPNDCDFLDVRPDFIFRSELVRTGVERFVSVKLEQNPTYFDNVFELPLCTAIDERYWSQGHMDTVKHFLDSGQDPNMGGSNSPWCQFVEKACGDREGDNFKIAMENTLFLVFLKHGARRDIRFLPRSTDSDVNADHKANPRLPCTQLIIAMFNHKLSHRFGNQCLGALHDFLDGNAEETTLQLEEALITLQIQIQEAFTQAVEPGRLRFLAQITQRIIQKGIHAKMDMGALVPGVRLLFSNRLGSTLVDMIQKKQDSQFYRSDNSPLKRCHDGTRPMPPFKRSKTDKGS